MTALLEILYATGMRVSELVTLPRSAARPGVRVLSIRGKGGRERMVPLVGAQAAEKLVLSTFHSFGVRFLQEENKLLGYDGRFVIFQTRLERREEGR